jgi:hypothetical protein
MEGGVGAEPGGGGGGGAAGEEPEADLLKAFRAAWAARLAEPLGALGGRFGGGGGVDLEGGAGAEEGGRGGAEGGVGAEAVGGGGARPDGLRDVGIGGFLPGGGGLGFDEMSTMDSEAPRRLPRRLARDGTTGAEGAVVGGKGGGAPPGTRGGAGAAPGGRGGAPPGGGLGALLRVDSGSDM